MSKKNIVQFLAAAGVFGALAGNLVAQAAETAPRDMGLVPKPVKVEITLIPPYDGAVRYTLDGSERGPSAKLYMREVGNMPPALSAFWVFQCIATRCGS